MPKPTQYLGDVPVDAASAALIGARNDAFGEAARTCVALSERSYMNDAERTVAEECARAIRHLIKGV